jgi:hypothetical protein
MLKKQLMQKCVEIKNIQKKSMLSEAEAKIRLRK